MLKVTILQCQIESNSRNNTSITKPESNMISYSPKWKFILALSEINQIELIHRIKSELSHPPRINSSRALSNAYSGCEGSRKSKFTKSFEN